MTERDKRVAALCRLLAHGEYRTLGELRLQLAALEGFYCSIPQLWKDLDSIGAEREVRWILTQNPNLKGKAHDHAASH